MRDHVSQLMDPYNPNGNSNDYWIQLTEDIKVLDKIKHFVFSKPEFFRSSNRHFAINTSRKISPADVYAACNEIFSIEDIKVKRIVKPLFNYVRISISNSVNNLFEG